MSIGKEIRCVLYTCASEGDNPFDERRQPMEHTTWRDAYRATRQECPKPNKESFGDGALREAAATMPEQFQFALVWRPFFRPFRLRVHDVVRIDGRLGRVVRVTECAAVVLVNPPARTFKTRFDREVRFQPSAVTVRISANSGTEILNRKPRKYRRNTQAERRLE